MASSGSHRRRPSPPQPALLTVSEDAREEQQEHPVQQGRDPSDGLNRAVTFLLTEERSVVEESVVSVPVRILGVHLRDPNRDRGRVPFGEWTRDLSDAEFARMFRMDRRTFVVLCDLLRPHYEVPRLAVRTVRGRSNPVDFETQVCITLRILGGGSYLDVGLNARVSLRSSVYACFWRLIDTINRAFALQFPHDNTDALADLATGFARRATNPLEGCVAALDGLAIEIERPPSTRVANSQSYFNRKGFFSYNLQALCDSRYKFMYASCAAAGSTHDSLAFAASSLGQLLQRQGLPKPYWIAGDEAYALSDCLLTPWPGRNLPPDREAFNFFLSSSRIHIEQAFGQLVARWGLLWRPIRLQFERVPDVVMALLKLHNFCIDRGAPLLLPTNTADFHLQSSDEVCEVLQGRRRDLETARKRDELTELVLRLGRLRPR